MAQIRIDGENWEFRAGGVPGEDRADFADLMDVCPSVEAWLRRAKPDARAMTGLRSLCQTLSLSSQLGDDELLAQVAASLRSRRVFGYRRTGRSKAKTRAKAAEAPAAQDPKVARIRVVGEEWEFRAGGEPPKSEAVDLLSAHSMLEPFLQHCKLDLQIMAAFRRLTQYLPAALSPTPGAGLAGQTPADELLKRIAAALRARQLRAFRIEREESGGAPPPEAGQAAGPTPAAAPPPAQEPDPDTFGANHDAQNQAASLQAAAAAGVPFCEECEKQRRAAA